MNRINLLILHSDTEYTADLSRVLALKDPIYSIALETENKLCFEGALEAAGEEAFDLILVDQEWKKRAEDEGGANQEKLIGLAEVSFPEGNQGYIYKYGGLDRICSELQFFYAEISGKRRTCLPGNKTQIVGFVSGAGGVGTSSLAISAARELTSLDKRDALYLSFEEAESTPVYIPMDEGRAGISEYLYYLFAREKEATASFVDGFIISDMYGLCAFRPAKGPGELSGLPDELQDKFFDSLYESGRFRHIFIDFPARMPGGIEHLMKYCHKIFLIDDGQPLSLWKNHRFIESISTEVFEEIEEHIIPVTNKWSPRDGEVWEDSRIFVEYDEESFVKSDFQIEISLQRRFGLGVKKIADELAAEM